MSDILIKLKIMCKKERDLVIKMVIVSHQYKEVSVSIEPDQRSMNVVYRPWCSPWLPNLAQGK